MLPVDHGLWEYLAVVFVTACGGSSAETLCGSHRAEENNCCQAMGASQGVASWGTPSAHCSHMLGLPSGPCHWMWKREEWRTGGVIYCVILVKIHYPTKHFIFGVACSQLWGAWALHRQQLWEEARKKRS